MFSFETKILEVEGWQLILKDKRKKSREVVKCKRLPLIEING